MATPLRRSLQKFDAVRPAVQIPETFRHWKPRDDIEVAMGVITSCRHEAA